MRAFLLVSLLTVALAGQGAPVPAGKPKPPPPPQQKSEAPAHIASVQFDAQGWPIVPGDTARPEAAPAVPAGETRRAASAAPEAKVDAGGRVGKPDVAPPASGMQFGSPLLEVYQATRAPAAFKALGGRIVQWRLTIHGTQGEVIGVRDVTQIADCSFAERDRLEYQDGTVYGRVGAAVYAERLGMPRPTLTDTAEQELALFGLHLRLPWCLGDGALYAVMGRDTQDRGGEVLVRALLERRPPRELDIVGPELDPRPRDHFELLYECSTGQPREFVHRFASSLQTRRVLLEDWRDVDGVRMPYRRVYVDDKLRPTTTLAIQKPIEALRVSERDFRLH